MVPFKEEAIYAFCSRLILGKCGRPDFLPFFFRLLVFMKRVSKCVNRQSDRIIRMYEVADNVQNKYVSIILKHSLQKYIIKLEQIPSLHELHTITMTSLSLVNRIKLFQSILDESDLAPTGESFTQSSKKFSIIIMLHLEATRNGPCLQNHHDHGNHLLVLFHVLFHGNHRGNHHGSHLCYAQNRFVRLHHD